MATSLECNRKGLPETNRRQLSSGLTILLASILPIGLPVSTTQTLVGAMLGAGLANGICAESIGVRDPLASRVIFQLDFAFAKSLNAASKAS